MLKSRDVRIFLESFFAYNYVLNFTPKKSLGVSKTWRVYSISHARATTRDSSNETRANRILFGTFDKSTKAEVFSLTRENSPCHSAQVFDGAYAVASLWNNAEALQLFSHKGLFLVFFPAHKTAEGNWNFLTHFVHISSYLK